MAFGTTKEHAADPRLSNIARADPTKWYKKRNLRFLYLIMVPCCLGVEWTSGFDSSMMNSLQAVQSWVDCKITKAPSLVELCSPLPANELETKILTTPLGTDLAC